MKWSSSFLNDEDKREKDNHTEQEYDTEKHSRIFLVFVSLLQLLYGLFNMFRGLLNVVVDAVQNCSLVDNQDGQISHDLFQKHNR